ncbi:MAG: hypothetical protein K2N94_16010, partial [Lachnospiraceae bacterium]|nr:hypothetical protein [Lachnospiraceae bacterium]
MEKRKPAVNDMEGRLTDEAELLNQYLSQYRYCINKKRILEKRRAEIIREFDSPLGAMKMDGMPRGSSSGVGCAALSFRLDEINTRIKEQMENAERVLADIMNVIDFLPENSLERSIIENRYIDRYNWERVCRENHISRTPATKKWRKGLYMILKYGKVKEILREYST